MAEKRISELTAKGATLGATDLLEISEPDGLGGYVSKRVTGSEVFAGVSTSNFASANLTFTANRTHNINTYDLTFDNVGTFKVDGQVKTISPSASSLDTAFSVRNNTDVSDLFKIEGGGRARFYGDIYSMSENIYCQNLNSLYFNFTGISIISGLTYSSRGEIGGAYTSHDFKTESLITTAGSYMMKVRNFNTLHFAVDKDGQIEMPNVQVGNAGLSAGDIYFDTAANILANGDLVCGRKV